MNLDQLRFPTGVSVAQAKKTAKRLSRKQSIPHSQALNHVARQNGSDVPWNRAIERLRLNSIDHTLYRRICIVEAFDAEVLEFVWDRYHTLFEKSVIRALFVEDVASDRVRSGTYNRNQTSASAFVGAMVRADVDIWVVGPPRNEDEWEIARETFHLSPRCAFLTGGVTAREWLYSRLDEPYCGHECPSVLQLDNGKLIGQSREISKGYWRNSNQTNTT